MKFLFYLLILIFNIDNINARNIGETEITAEEGIEVFQDEKYYLLKKNVNIESDNFVLKGDEIKIFYELDLYDLKTIDAKGGVRLNSPEYNLIASGEKLKFTVNNEIIFIEGKNSKLITKDTEMQSDGSIEVNNTSGNFSLNGPNSELKAENIKIIASEISGVFSFNETLNEIILLYVSDENIAYVDTDNIEMYANNINYNKENSTIELENNVKIISDGEEISGDYGTIDTMTNSYKIKSKESKKVKVIITNNNE